MLYWLNWSKAIQLFLRVSGSDNEKWNIFVIFSSELKRHCFNSDSEITCHATSNSVMSRYRF